MIASETRPQDPKFRVIRTAGDAYGMPGEIVLIALRYKAGMWIPATPTISECEEIENALAGLPNDSWLWLA